MAYIANQLIANAWYLSGVVSRGLETVSNQQLSDGLQRLNGLLAIKTANMGLIPYYKEYDINTVIGQETYAIPGLLSGESLTFNIGPVRYSTLPKTRQQYFGTPRVDNIQSLIFSWHTERTKGGSNLYVYFLPQDVWTMKLWGKFGLDSVTSQEDLSLIYENYYLEYLLYGLAEYLCEFYNVAFSEIQSARLNQYEKVIREISPMDTTMQKMSSFAPNLAFNYANANIGHGWTKP